MNKGDNKMMQYNFKKNLIIVIILILNISSKIGEASVEFLNPYYPCAKNFYDLTTMENEAEDDDMLIRAKISYKEKRYEDAIRYADQAIQRLEAEAKLTQDSLEECPWISNAEIFKNKSLNTVGLALLIKGRSYVALDKQQKAEDIYGQIWNKYPYALCWCKKGLFLKPVDLVQDELFLGTWGVSQSENSIPTLESYKKFQITFLHDRKVKVRREIKGKIKIKKGFYQFNNEGLVTFSRVLESMTTKTAFRNGNLMLYLTNPPLVLEKIRK